MCAEFVVLYRYYCEVNTHYKPLMVYKIFFINLETINLNGLCRICSIYRILLQIRHILEIIFGLKQKDK